MTLTHAERAEQYRDEAIEAHSHGAHELARAQLALAQIEATLAVAAEQKRIADWLEAVPLGHEKAPAFKIRRGGEF